MATHKPSKQTPYEKITNRILELLDKGTVPWHRPWMGCRNLASGKDYRGINPFVLGCQAFASPFWLTYRQAQERGGNVRKGERACPVVFWKVYKAEEAVERGGETTGTREVSRFVLRHYSVFNVEQCEGVEVPAIEAHEHEPIQACEETVAGMAKRPDVRNASAGAFYSPGEDFVSLPGLPSFDSPEHYYSTLFHELTHATGHKTRLGRHGEQGYVSHHFGSGDYSREELVAEMGAAFLSGHCGIENGTIDNSAAYINSWRRKLGDEPRLVILAAAQAQKAADFILGRKYDTEGGAS